MIRVNLLPAEEADAAAARRAALTELALVGLAAALVLGSAHARQWTRGARAERELGRLAAELKEARAASAGVAAAAAEERELARRLATIATLEARRAGLGPLLEDVAAAVPEKLWLTELAAAGQSLRLSGLGADEQTIAEFIRSLSQSPSVRRVDLVETALVEHDGVEHRKFALDCAVDDGSPAR